MRNKTPIIIVSILIFLVCIAFGWYAYTQYREEQRIQTLYATYPIAYNDLIEQYASQYELDPYLVTAIVRCESSNQIDAVSSDGAIGLMQIMPDTGEWIAHKLNMEPFDTSALYNAETNILFGCWYLHFLTGRLSANSVNVIAAYNAGHGSVEGWLENESYAENGTLVVIPYPETERYVEKVQTAYKYYRELYPELYPSN